MFVTERCENLGLKGVDGDHIIWLHAHRCALEAAGPRAGRILSSLRKCCETNMAVRGTSTSRRCCM